MKDRVGTIYGLIDPRYGIIRYDGQTVMSLDARFRGHLHEMDATRSPNYKTNWMRKLRTLGLQTKPVVLAHDVPVPFVTYLQNGDKWEAFYDFDALDREERYFIAISREECATFGIQCVNGTEGGDGGSKTQATREKMSRANKGKNLGRPSWCKGKTKNTDPALKRLSEKLTGRERSPEHCARISASKKGQKRTPEEIERFRLRMMGNKNTLGMPAWNKGLTKETDTRIAQYAASVSKAKTGKPLSAEARERRRMLHPGKGLRRSEEARANIRAAHGRPEYIEALRQANIGERNPMHGKTHSPEARAKIAEKAKGRTAWNKGKQCPSVGNKLTEDKVRDIRMMYNDGARGVDLAGMFNVSQQTIFAIVHGLTWRHVA